MIQKISLSNNINFKGKQEKIQSTKADKKNTFKNFSDSFVKHSVQQTPMLLALTGVWSLIDKKTSNIPLSQSVMNNICHFFLPVMLVSSLILSLFDNKRDMSLKK